MPFLKDKAPRREDAPRLKAVEGVNAEGKAPNTVDEAMNNVQGGAGPAELNWVIDNSVKARKMLKVKDGDGNEHFYFPNAGDDKRVPYVRWDAGELHTGFTLRKDYWSAFYHVLVIG